MALSAGLHQSVRPYAHAPTAAAGSHSTLFAVCGQHLYIQHLYIQHSQLDFSCLLFLIPFLTSLSLSLSLSLSSSLSPLLPYSISLFLSLPLSSLPNPPPIQWLCRPWGSIQLCHFHYATPINHGIIILPNTVKEYLHYSSSPSTYQQLELGSRPQQHNTNRNSQMDIHILCTCTAVVY